MGIGFNSSFTTTTDVATPHDPHSEIVILEMQNIDFLLLFFHEPDNENI